MKVTQERLPESRVLLDIEVDPERLEKSIDAAYKKVAKQARIPGFRPGKAPRRVVERMVGREGLIREALDTLVPDVYNEALEQEDIDAVDQPELEIVEIDPVHFKATVPVRHTADLDDYKAVSVEKDPVEVNDEDVEEQLEMLRRRFATQVPVERPVQWDDILIADVASTIDDEPFVEDNDAEFGLREDTTLLVPGLAEAFIGMEAGEEKTVELPIPDDFQVERYQGKTASFTLTVKEIKEEQLPDLDDDLAQQVNEEEFPTFQALRDRIENDLSEQKQRESDNKAQQEAIDAMVERATLEYPRVYVEREIDSLVRENVGQDRDQYLQYLERMGQTEQEFRESLAEEAQRRVERSLVISKLAEIENIEVSEEEVDEQLDSLVQPAGEEASRLRELFDTEEGRATIRRNVLSDKTLARIVEIATVGDGSGGGEEQTSAAAAGDPESGDAADAEQKEDAE